MAASLCLHMGAAGFVEAIRLLRDGPASASPSPLLARLRPPPELPDRMAEPLLKDTLSEEAPPALPSEAAPSVSAARRPPAEAAARRKLLEHLFYPAEAIERNIEGTVRLLIAFDAAGRVVSVEVAAGSSHSELDRAAVEAARAIGRLPGAGPGTMILPVVFRLE